MVNNFLAEHWLSLKFIGLVLREPSSAPGGSLTAQVVRLPVLTDATRSKSALQSIAGGVDRFDVFVRH